MIASRASALVLACLVAGAVAAAAQEERAPLRLLPALGEEGAEPPAPATPVGREPQGAPAGPAGEVSIGPLEGVSGDALGLLAPEEGGLGRELWHGAEASRALALIERLPERARSLAMRSLMHRLLASAAPPPQPVPPRRVFLASRLAALIRLGAFDDAAALSALVPMASVTSELSALEADALFWAGEVDQACALARAEIRANPTLDWLKAMVFCQQQQGDLDAARLSLALVREQVGEKDAAFVALAAVLLGDRDDAPAGLESGLAFAMTVAAERPIAPARLAEAGAAPARAVALSPLVAVESRLVAGERAAALGALATDELAGLYAVPEFTDDELVDARLIAGDSPGALGRALLFQASRQQQQPDTRAPLLDALWSSPVEGPGFVALARVAGITLLTISPDPTVVWFAPDAIRALLASGRGEAAQAWYLALAESAIDDPEALAAQKGALPLLAAARVGIGRNWEPAMAEQWWRGLPESFDAAARAAAASRVFMVLDALGERIGRRGWDLFLEAPARVSVEIPNLGIRYALRDAARAGQRGETVALAMLALGDAGPAGASALTLGTVVRALRAVGLEDDARAIALEALIEGGR
jgi:hypothetical protein